MVNRYQIGLEKRVVTPDQNKPDSKEEYWAVAIFIPAPDRPGRFHVKKRVAPWLNGEKRPEYLAKWAQFGLKTTIWFSHEPKDAEETWLCEGEWDSILLGELVRQRGARAAVACSTSGAGTLPPPEQLERLPGHVTIFYDRDEAGAGGAEKLAAALKDRATIGLVPMPDDCQVKGWDVSDAIQTGYRWEDFEAADVVEPEEKVETTPPNESGISFKVLRRSLDQTLEIFPELQSDAGKDWLKMRKFTPDHVVNSKYFDWPSDQPGSHLAVRSGLGTGKTHHVHTKFLKDDNIGANAFGYRNSLLIQFTERGNEAQEGKKSRNPWYHLQQDLKNPNGDKDDLMLIRDPRSRVAACFDSLIYFNPEDFKEKRLVLDEIEGSFKHLYQSQTAVSYHRQFCKQRAGDAIANSEAVILLDGNLTDLTVAHAERISGKKFTKVQNQFKGNRGKATLYTGTLKFGKDEETGKTVVTERRLNDFSLLNKMMMDDPEPFICGSDSQQKLEAWDQILRLKGKKVFRLDGSNSNTPEAKKFLANPTAYVYINKIDAVLYSPTAESGLSIDTETEIKLKEWLLSAETEIETESGEVLQVSIKGYFKRSYFFFTGVVQTDVQSQFLGRLRDPDTHILIFCQNQGIDSSKLEQTATNIQEAYLDYTLACSKISLLDVSEGEKQRLINEQAHKLAQRSNDAHFQYECHLKAREVFERNHLRKCLEYSLHTAGYQVEVVAGFKVDKKELEAAQKAIQVKKAHEIFQAKTLTEEEANEKARNFEATQQEKTEVTKHRLISRLPGIEDKTQTVSRVVTLPQSAVAEIKSGRVSFEIAQKLGIPTPETPTGQAIELGHLPLNFSINQGEGVPPAGEDEFNRNGGGLTSEGAEICQNGDDQKLDIPTDETPTTQALEVGHLPQNSLSNQGEGVPAPAEDEFNRSGGGLGSEDSEICQNESDQKLGIPTAETPTMQAIEVGHLPHNSLNNQGEGVPPAAGGEVEIVITETKPIFDPEFIRKVKYQDRAWLSKVELHYLIDNPDIAKLLQQRKWYTKLKVFSDPNQPDFAKYLNLSTYKSDWLKVHTLLEMGLGFFLNPDSRWTQDSPEAVEFWEKGKDARRAKYIGTAVGDANPCEYIGRILNKLDVKRKCDRVRNDAGEKIRVYRVDTDYLSSPMRAAVYECVKKRIESKVQSDSYALNWDAIIENNWANEADQKADIPTSETLTIPGLEVGHLPQNSLSNQGEGVPPAEGRRAIEEVMDALLSCHSFEDLKAIAAAYCNRVLADAIDMQDSQQRRRELRQWFEELSFLNLNVTEENAARLLRKALGYGANAIRVILERLAIPERWKAVTQFNDESFDDMQRLMAIAPNWAEWCG
jgi:hypothetical protein